MADPKLLKVEITPPLRDLQGQYASATKELVKLRRDQLRRIGRFGVKVLAEEAPKGETGKFARSHRYRTDLRGGGAMTLTFYSTEPLGTWLREGTKDHFVAPVNAQALHWTEGGQHFFSKGHVVSGIEPNPYHHRALDRMRPEIAEDLARLGRTVVERLAGK